MTNGHSEACGCCDCQHRPPKGHDVGYILERVGRVGGPIRVTSIKRCHCACYAPYMACESRSALEAELGHWQEQRRNLASERDFIDSRIADLEARLSAMPEGETK